MMAAIYYGAHDIRIEETPAPGSLSPGEVLVRPAFAGICGTDLHEYVAGPIVISTPEHPHPLTGASLPQILGHEFSATVLAVAADVEKVSPGDRVSIQPIYSCGKCAECRRGEPQVCKLFAAPGLNARWGALAEQAIVLETQCIVLPDAVSLEQGALLEPAKVAAYAVDRGRLKPGGSVLIVGGGPIGALAALYAHAAGAGAIVIAELNAERRHRLQALGVARVVDPASEDVQALVLELTHGQGVDVAIEAAGANAAFAACAAAVRPQGVIVQAALHTKNLNFDAMALSLKDVSVEFTWCWKAYDWEETVSLISSGRFPVEKVITSVIPLDSVVGDGYEVLINPAGSDLKILVDLAA